MDMNCTIRVLIERTPNLRTEINVPGDGDLLHALAVFQLALSALGIELDQAAGDAAVH